MANPGRLGFLLLLAAAVSGCGDDDHDGALDAAIADAQPADRTIDGRIDATLNDAAGRVPLQSSDAGAGVFRCGNMTCGASQVCCLTDTGSTIDQACIPVGGACAMGSIATCDGTEDCNAARGEVCCGRAQLSGGTTEGNATCRVYGPNEGECTGAFSFSSGQVALCNDVGPNSVDCPSDRPLCQRCTILGNTVDFCNSALTPGCAMTP